MRISGDVSPASSSGAAVESCTTGPSEAASSPADLIEVRGPYCALQDVVVSRPGSASALVWPEQPLVHEIGEISAAEAGRHMAILGSIASATQERDQSRRSYYLATRAILSTPDEVPRAYSGGPLRVEADCVESNLRTARAECQIREADGRQLFGLQVTYKLVPQKIFQRLFAAHRVDLRRSNARPAQLPEALIRQHRKNPYRQRLDAQVIDVDARRVHARVAEVAAEACAGHFPLYPAIPVAVLMEACANAGGVLLRRHFDRDGLPYRVRNGDISASKLGFAGQAIVIRGELVERISDWALRMRMRVTLDDGEPLIDSTMTLEGVPSVAGAAL